MKAAPKNIYPKMSVFTTDSKKGEEVADNLVLYVQTIAVEFLTGKTDISTFWDSYVSVCEHLGVQNSLKKQQRSYDRYVKNVK